MKISTFTTYTKPEIRGDPWREALNCYNSYSDEVVVVGEDWPDEFKFSLIGKYFQKGFDLCNGDWVLRMDIDYFIHEKNNAKLRKVLNKYSDYPAVAFPQYQFFTPERYQIKTRLCVALNKNKFPNIKLNGGGDLCLPTLNNVILDYTNVPSVNIPIYQYDSLFRTKKIIAEDRARFARAWNREFGNYGNRGGPDSDAAFEAWFEMIKIKYYSHTHRIDINKHPKYLKDRISLLSEKQFGYSAFGLKGQTQRDINIYLKGYREKYINPLIYKLK